MIGNIINKIDKIFGIIFFKNLNSLSYNLFNFFLRKNILNLKEIKNKKHIYEFEKYGYSKLNNFNIGSIDKLNSILKKQNPKKNQNNRFEYFLDKEIIDLIKKIVNIDCNYLLKDLAEYYNSNIYLGHALITRNYNYNPEDGESYSSYFHCDGYLNTYFKILVNLSSVTSEMGPIHVIDKIETKKNVGLLKYSSRNLKKEDFIKSKIFKNTSNIGDGLLINTTECLHKAGIPTSNNYRDMLYLVFCAYPEKSKNIFHYENIDKSIWGKYSKLVKKLAKPYGFINLLNLYNNFSKNNLK